MSKGRFRKKNFKDEVIEDFGKVCVNQCISKQAVYDMAWRVSWEWTDTIGRYINCKYWSKDALDYLKEGLTPDANGNYKKQSKKEPVASATGSFVKGYLFGLQILHGGPA